MRKLRNWAILMLLIFISGYAAKAGEDFKPVKYEMETLDNGLQVIYSIDKSAPIVATVVHYKVGSRDENPSRTGFAHFFEHLMFEGTNNIPRASIDKYVEESGGWLNAHTSFDETVYKFRVPANEIRLALWIESQRMRGLLVDDIGVETQRGVVKEERKMRTDNTAYGTMFENMAGMLFNGTSYQWTPIGYEKDINQATVQEFRDFYDNFYQPNNAVLAIVGDFNIDDAKKYVRQYFGDIPKGKEPKREPFKLTPFTQGAEKTVEDPKAQLPGVFVGYRGPKLAEDDYYAMSLLGDILASGESSRLYQRLVDKDQLAVYASIQPMSLQNAGVAMLIGIPTIGKDPKDVLEVMTDEINKIVKDGVTEEELEKAKNITESQVVSGNKTALEKAQSLARYYVYFDDPGVINTELKRFQSVSQQDIKDAAKKYLATDKRVVLYYEPKSSN